jgi:hypothetical protein
MDGIIPKKVDNVIHKNMLCLITILTLYSACSGVIFAIAPHVNQFVDPIVVMKVYFAYPANIELYI